MPAEQHHPQTLPTAHDVFGSTYTLDMASQTSFFQLGNSHTGTDVLWLVFAAFSVLNVEVILAQLFQPASQPSGYLNQKSLIRLP